MHAQRLQSQVAVRHASAVRHVVSFEEAGECTLERIAREAQVGDEVMVLGPEAWASFEDPFPVWGVRGEDDDGEDDADEDEEEGEDGDEDDAEGGEGDA